MDVRAYDADGDRAALWSLKRAFELELGGDEMRAAYASKLTEAYRERYLDWVDRCVGETPECVTVADDGGALVGYAFLLPASFAMIWDAAVLNEIYVEPDARGAGVADRLLESALDVARDQSLPMNRVVLDVAPTSDRARSFYVRHGFEPWGELVAREL
ncbi:MAG: N-acetyltransferase family protein [Halobacteriales archaeon]